METHLIFSKNECFSDPVIVGGLPLSPVTRQGLALRFLADYLANTDRKAESVFSTSANGHVLALAARDPAFRAMLEEADHIDADGMPLVLASRYLATRALPERIATTDFIHDVALTVKGQPVRFFLLGASAEENQGAIQRLRHLYPYLHIDGHHGYYDPRDEAALVGRILDFQTDLLWVGLGLPREHAFVLRQRKNLRGVTWIKTCGGLFNFLSGSRSRAPLWVQNIGMEWVWRMLQEPSRLAPRYVTTNGEALRLLWRHRAR